MSAHQGGNVDHSLYLGMLLGKPQPIRQREPALMHYVTRPSASVQRVWFQQVLGQPQPVLRQPASVSRPSRTSASTSQKEVVTRP